MNEKGSDYFLRQKAKARAGFSRALITYVIFQIFFVAIWYFSTYKHTGWVWRETFWPIRPMIWRWIGMLSMYLKAYGNMWSNIQKEYNKLVEENKNK